MDKINGIPLWKPPYGRIAAIDLNRGDPRWMVAVGDLAKENPVLQQLGLSPVGRPARGHLLLTKTLLIVGLEGSTQRELNVQREAGAEPAAFPVPNFEVRDPKLVAYDKTTGKVVGEVTLPRNATAAPMTYMLNRKQYIAFATGGANLPTEMIVPTIEHPPLTAGACLRQPREVSVRRLARSGGTPDGFGAASGDDGMISEVERFSTAAQVHQSRPLGQP